MLHRTTTIQKLMLLALVLSFSIGLSAQSEDDQITGTLCADENGHAEEMLLEINEIRAANNLLPFVFSEVLCQTVTTQMNDILARVGTPGLNMEISSDGSGLRDWLTRDGFQPYVNEYVADFFPWSALDTPLDADEGGSGYPGIIRFLFNTREPFQNLIVNRNYREIGIAYVPSLGLDGVTRYYYLFIAGAQPNQLPIIPVDLLTGVPIAQALDRQIGLLVYTERYAPDGVSTGNVIGRVVYIRPALDEDDIENCPVPDQPLPAEWEQFTYPNTIPYPYEIIGPLGRNEIYIQLCDGRGNTTMSFTTINYEALPPLTPPTLTASPTDTPTLTPSIMPTVPPTDTPTLSAEEAFDLTLTADALLAQQTQTAQAATQVVLDVTATFESLVASATASAVNAANATNTALAQTVQVSPNATETVPPTEVRATTEAPSPTTMVTEPTPVSPTPSPSPEITATTEPSLMPQPTTPTNTATPVDIPTLGLYWNNEFLIVHNPGDEPLPLEQIANLRFEARDEDDNLSSTFSGAEWLRFTSATTLSADRCLLVLDANGATPDDSQINNVFAGCDLSFGITSTAGISVGDLFWMDNFTSFSVYADETLIGTCEVNRRNCQIPQEAEAIGREIVSTPEIAGLPIDLFWNAQVLVVINNNDAVFDLSTLTLRNGNGSVTWGSSPFVDNTEGLTQIPPYYCLLAYSAADYREERPPLPEGVTCANEVDDMIAVGIDYQDMVWTDTSFDVVIDGTVRKTCELASVNNCIFFVAPR